MNGLRSWYHMIAMSLSFQLTQCASVRHLSHDWHVQRNIRTIITLSNRAGQFPMSEGSLHSVCSKVGELSSLITPAHETIKLQNADKLGRLVCNKCTLRYFHSKCRTWLKHCWCQMKANVHEPSFDNTHADFSFQIGCNMGIRQVLRFLIHPVNRHLYKILTSSTAVVNYLLCNNCQVYNYSMNVIIRVFCVHS
jgi:hypothetical protein